MIRVHVVHEERVMREAIADALSREPGLSVVGLSGHDCRDVARSRPDVVLHSVGHRSDVAQLVADCRELSPRAKIVLLLLGGIRDGVGSTADAAVDASDGLAALAAAVRAMGG